MENHFFFFFFFPSHDEAVMISGTGGLFMGTWELIGSAASRGHVMVMALGKKYIFITFSFSYNYISLINKLLKVTRAQ